MLFAVNVKIMADMTPCSVVEVESEDLLTSLVKTHQTTSKIHEVTT
jgi:hypothetical protein